MTTPEDKPAARSAIGRLLEIMARLRAPEGGCPWDLEQNFRSIAPYTIEEAYEVADAIERADMAGLKDELGDLLLQVVFHSRMAEERGLFDFAAVAEAISEKMVRRHPHVFGDAVIADAAHQTRVWEDLKARERSEKTGPARSASLLADVPRALPALVRASKLQARAARTGFDWPSRDGAFAKLEEELGELSEEIYADAAQDRLEDELGDVLFALVNVARWLDIDPETALRRTNEKFIRRFGMIEEEADKSRQSVSDMTLEHMEKIWQASKTRLP